MKEIILVFSIFFCSTFAIAQKDSNRLYRNVRYCAQLKDGLLVIISDNKQITSDIITANGTTIKANGNVIKKDGVTTYLKEGECIDTRSVMVRNKNKDKAGKGNQDNAFMKE